MFRDGEHKVKQYTVITKNEYVTNYYLDNVEVFIYDRILQRYGKQYYLVGWKKRTKPIRLDTFRSGLEQDIYRLKRCEDDQI